MSKSVKWRIAIIVLVIFLIVLGTAYVGYNFEESGDAILTAMASDELVLSAQDARILVTVERAILSKAGYVVIRGGDNRRIGQVIEVSRYLNAGTNQNVVVELGDLYTYKKNDQLVAMIYHDDGDQSFNELDQPVNSSAVYVETGKQVLASVFEHEVAPRDGVGMVTVRYANSGFEPARLTVPLGSMVEFINQSDQDMWVASDTHPLHEILPTFDQFKGVRKGQSYMYIFDRNGEWSYHDHINPALEGVIVVE